VPGPVLSDARNVSRAERFRLVRELGSRAVPTWAALDSQATGRRALVVVERVSRGGEYGDEEIGDWVRDARRLAKLEHPNMAKIREVVIRGDDVLVASDYVDGVRWSEIASAAQVPSLEVTLRIFIDVLAGLSALHDLRDEQQQPLRLMHGELTPECIVVGSEGVSKVVSACRLRSATARPGRAGSAYLAPEVLLADDSADSRADVYSVGVMLWEAISGRPLFPNTQPAAIVTHLLSGRIPAATVPAGNEWAQPLVAIVKRALSVEPDKRFQSAAALGAELKRAAGVKVATSVRVAAFLRPTFGDRIRQRRSSLESGEGAVETVETVETVEEVVAAPPPAPPVMQPRPEPSRPPPVMPVRPSALAAPRLPEDLVAAAGALEVGRPVVATSSAPAGAPLTGLALEPRNLGLPTEPHRRRGTWLAPLLFGLAVTSGAGLWWVLGKKAPAQAESAPSHVTPEMPRPSAAATVPSSVLPAEAPSAVAAPEPSATDAPTAATHLDAPPEPAATPQRPQAAPSSQATSRRPPNKGKYDPEGI
jgi:eukaryotic-like serine/threonine-protein kinase